MYYNSTASPIYCQGEKGIEPESWDQEKASKRSKNSGGAKGKNRHPCLVIMLGHAGKFCKALISLSSGYLPISAQGLSASGVACPPLMWWAVFGNSVLTFAPGFLLCLFSDR
jgi:hypothetical protein